MKFVILFKDDPDADPDIRTTHMPRHLDFLDRQAGRIEAAGPLFDGDGNSRGGLWIVEAKDEAEVMGLVHDDPFWPTGLRKSVEILRWRQVHSDGKRRIDPK